MKLPSNPTSCWRLFEEQAMAVVTSKSFFFASCLPEQPCKPVPCSTPVCQCLGSHHPPNMPGFLPTATIYSHPHLPRTHTHTHTPHASGRGPPTRACEDHKAGGTRTVRDIRHPGASRHLNSVLGNHGHDVNVPLPRPATTGTAGLQ